jgi:mRNA interferase MazF
LDPTEGPEQAGTRPAVVVTRDAINTYSPVVIVTPGTNAANITRLYPSDVLVRASEGGLTIDSVFLTLQTRAVAKTRFVRLLGSLKPETMEKIDQALRVTLDLR